MRLFLFRTYSNSGPRILDSKNHTNTFTRNPAILGAETDDIAITLVHWFENVELDSILISAD